MLSAKSRENPFMKTGNLDAFFREKYLTKNIRLEYLGKKALAVNSKITIRLPKAKYAAYVKMIKKSGRYATTKFQKI